MSELPLWLVLSKLLSLLVVLGSLIGKLPQVHKILKAKSAEGVSRISMWADASSFAIQLAYNILRETPITTYGEVPILFVQALLLITVASWYNGDFNFPCCSMMLALLSGTVAMSSKIVPVTVTMSLYTLNAALGVFCTALPQIVMNCRSKSTGQLSFIVTAMTFGGCSTRVFTTYAEVEDVALRTSITVNWVFVAIVMIQFKLYYAKPTDTPPEPVQTRQVTMGKIYVHKEQVDEDELRPLDGEVRTDDNTSGNKF